MRILMISTDWRIGVLGSKEHQRMASYGTIAEELHIIVFSLSGQGLKESHSGNLHVYPTNSWSKLFYGLGAYFISIKLRKKGITLVTAQDPFETGFIGLKISEDLNVPFHVQLHTDFAGSYYGATSFKNRLRVLIADYVIPRANCIRVVSYRLQKYLMERYALTKPPFVLPIHTEIPVTMLTGRKDFLHAKYPEFGTIAVMVSRLEPEKNIYMAIQSIVKLTRQYPGLGLLIVGDGSIRHDVQRMVNQLGIEQKVIFAGWQDQSISYFLSADLFLNTSNYEGYGRTLIEAAAAECPIITTNVGIVGEILNEDNALISEPQDQLAFENNLEFALRNPKIMKEKAAEARRAVGRYIAVTEDERLELYKRSWEECSK